MSQSLRIVITGLVAQYPLGGMTWHYLQYVRGLARLGHDVYYLEDTGKAPYSPSNGAPARDGGANVAYLARAMADSGLSDRWAYRLSPEGRWFGLPEGKRREVLRSADLLINVSGSLGRPQEYLHMRRLAYIDTDPVFTQVKLARGLADFRSQVEAHHVHFSFGERVAETMPATGHRWLPTRQPVLLSEWRPDAPRRQVFTTVMNWAAKVRPQVYDGRSYGQKDVEFARFIGLPRRVAPTVLELAVNAGKGCQAPHALLTGNGWRLVDPEVVCLGPNNYRRYIESSLGEWSIAKNGYVEGQSGWFSERSACYLAAGRPVIVQHTGFSDILPAGEGIVPFETPEEAAEAIRAVTADYGRHSRAARAIAAEYFASDRVLTRLLEEALRADA